MLLIISKEDNEVSVKEKKRTKTKKFTRKNESKYSNPNV